MAELESVGVLEKKYSRRTFIKGVIATGATVSSASYVFRGPAALGAATLQSSTERLVTLNVNGQSRPVDVLPHETLAMTLRYKLNLTGTKLGCDRAECGACTVLVDGVNQYACSMLTHQVRGREVTTIEAMSAHPVGAAVQAAWVAEDVPQCGYCQSGQIMSATALLSKNARPSDADIDAAMAGNICRCGTYTRIRAAIKSASDAVA